MYTMNIELKKILSLLLLMILMSIPKASKPCLYTMTVKTEKLLPLLLLVALMNAPTESATATAAPTLNYTCTADGNITIAVQNINDYQRITVLQASQKNLMTENARDLTLSTCEKELSDISDAIALTKCPWGKPLYVYIMKERLHKIYGGKDIHEYIIKCDLPSEGVTQTVRATAFPVSSFQTSPATALIRAPTLALQMTITPSTEVVVGQQLQLQIKLTNLDPQFSSSLHVLPESCIAFPDESSRTPFVQLLSNGHTNDKGIMTNFTVTAGSANASVYAFRFYDSERVIIECKVHICGDKSCNTKFQAYASTPPTTKTTTTTTTTTKSPVQNRKRRAAQIMPKKKSPTSTRVVKAMFTVKDEENHTSGQSAVFTSFITMFILMQLQRILQQQQ